jgi:tetratricopeptide (TPR) repeat protein
MKRAAELAWDKKWSSAIQEYGRALEEFPQDVAALTGLGRAYVETRQLDKALQVYQLVADLAPDNPEVIQRVGYVCERLARLPDAARAYVLAGEAAEVRRDLAQAIEMWKRASLLAPENLDAHRNLIRMYREQGQGRKAVWQYLAMSRVLVRGGEFDQATDCAYEAVRLDPRNAEARVILEALQRGLPLPDGPTARLQPDAEGKRTLDSFVVFEDIEIKGAASLRTAPRRPISCSSDRWARWRMLFSQRTWTRSGCRFARCWPRLQTCRHADFPTRHLTPTWARSPWGSTRQPSISTWGCFTVKSRT